MNVLAIILAGMVSLTGHWQFRCTSPEGEWHQGTVPGCVHTDLLSQGMIQDPFYADNEKRLQWIGEKDWEYARTFQYYARRAYKETIVSPYITEKGKVAVRLVTDSEVPAKTTLELYRVAFDGATTAFSSIDVVIPADASVDACVLGEGSLTDFELSGNEMLYVRLVSRQGLLSDNIFFKGRLNTHCLDDSKPEFRAVSVDGGVELSIVSDSPVLGLHIDIDGADQKTFSDNWVDIIPGFGKTIEIHTALRPEELLEKIEYKSINHIMQ